MTRSCAYEFGTIVVKKWTNKYGKERVETYTGTHLGGVPVGVGRFESEVTTIYTTLGNNSLCHGFQIEAGEAYEQRQTECRDDAKEVFGHKNDGLTSNHYHISDYSQ